MPDSPDSILKATENAIERACDALRQGTACKLDECTAAVLEAIHHLRGLAVPAPPLPASQEAVSEIAADLKVLNAHLRHWAGWLQGRAETAGQTGVSYNRQGIVGSSRSWFPSRPAETDA